MEYVYMWQQLTVGNKKLKYYISPLGEIMNFKGKCLKQRVNNRGYHIIDLYIDSVKTTFLVHRLVALNFIPNPNNLPTVNHKDGNKNHNYDFNLEWVSYSENNKHAYDTNLRKSLKGIESPFAKYTEELVREICQRLEQIDSPKEISEELQVPLSLVRSIKSKESWISVSSEYQLRNTRFFMDVDTRKKIIDLYNQGVSTKEIVGLIGWENNSKYYKRIKRVIDKSKGSTTSRKA